MRLLAIEAVNFGVLKDFKFEFPEAPGLYMLTGSNDDEPQLGSNGSGKSTLFKAACWCLYGRTPDGLRAGDVASWGVRRRVVVTLRIGINDEEHILQRTWQPNELRLDGRQVTQEEVDACVRMNYAQHLACRHIAQGAPTFLDLKPEAKTTFLSTLLDIFPWDQARRNATQAATNASEKVRALDVRVASIEGGVAHAATTLVHAEERLAHAIETQHQRLLEWEAQDDWLGTAALALMEARDAHEHKQQQQTYTHALQRLERKTQDARRDVDRAERRLDLAQDRLAQIGERLTKAQQQHDCPSCGQPLTPQHRRSVLRELVLEQSQARDALNAARADLTQLLGVLEDAVADEGLVRIECQGIVEQLEHARSAHAEAKQQHGEFYYQRSRAYAELTAATEFRHRCVKELDELHGLQETAADEVAQAQSEKAAWQLEQQQAAFWDRGFAEARLFMLVQALDALEVETNAALHELGLEGWSLHFAVDSETRAGTIRRGFTASVQSPHYDGVVPFEAWSGGEAQRLRVACAMGIATLVAQARGDSHEFEVWDEATNWMSPQGVSDLITAFAARAQSKRMQVWIVDHRSLDMGTFTATYLMRKHDGQSTIDP
jgi:DNA repair exonuclease SbcCD ATPase subunit